LIKFQNIDEWPRQALSPKKALAFFLGFLALVFALYSGVSGHEYVLDDEAVFSKNAFTQKGVAGISEIVTHSYFYGYKDIYNLTYRPLSVVSFAIEKDLFGNNPKAGHFINLFLYALSSFFIFIWLRLLFRNKSMAIPLITSLLFLVHPLHVEVVANIKSRDELLALSFILLSLIFFLKYFDQKNAKFLSGGALCFTLALFSKESTVTFLVLVPLTLYFFAGVKFKEVVKPSLCLLPGVLAYFAMRVWVLGSMTGADTLLQENVLRQASSFPERLATGISLMGQSLMLLVFPKDLVYDYSSLEQVPLVNFDSLIVWAVLLPLGYFFYRAVKKIKEKELLTFGILFALITYSVTSNIFVLSGVTFAERHLFIPSLGFCFCLALLLYQLFEKKQNILFGLVGLFLLLWSVKTLQRVPDWQSNGRLFARDYKKAPTNPRLIRDYCRVRIDQALQQQRQGGGREMLEEVEGILKGRLEKAPEDKRSLVILGLTYLHLGHNDKAIEVLTKVRDRREGGRYFMIAMTKRRMDEGMALEKQGKFEEAIKYFEVVVKNVPAHFEAFDHMGRCYEELGLFDKAKEMFLRRDALRR
jgi:hypothetical protein